MAVIDSVLRQHRWQLEEQQRYLTDLEALAVRLQRDAIRLQGEVEREAQLAGLSLENGEAAIDPVFLRPLIERRDKLNNSLAEIEGQIAEARAAVEAAVQELRVYELSSTPRDPEPMQRLTRRSRRLQQLRQRQAAARNTPA
jgi:DNA repair ATPase RecN